MIVHDRTRLIGWLSFFILRCVSFYVEFFDTPANLSKIDKTITVAARFRHFFEKSGRKWFIVGNCGIVLAK